MPKWGKTCNFPCISSQSGKRFERVPPPPGSSQVIPWVSAFPALCRSVLSVLISGKGFCFSDHARSPDLLCVPSCPLWLKVLGSPISRDVGDSGDLAPPLPPPRSSQIGVDLQRVHPRSSQIGVAFSDEASIGVELTRFPFRAMSCDHGDSGDPVPLPLAAN
jgi:hypothetical protein